MSELALPYNFEPRGYQYPLWQAFDSGIRRLLAIWHRRAGKDKCFLNLMARETQERVGVYYYILPTYAQGKKIIWDGIDYDGFRFLNHFPRELWDGTPNQTEMKIRLKNGSLFQVVGSDNVDSIVGTNPVGVVFSEYSLQDPAAWSFIRPILAENGGWAAFNGTPRGKNNHLYKLYESVKTNPDWFVEVLGADKTKAISEELIEAERKAGMDEELIQQEFYCSFEGGMSGSYYAPLIYEAQNQGRVTDVPYDPMLKVDTWWDIGVHDSTAITFVQQSPGSNQIRIIDYYEMSGEGLNHYTKYLSGLPYTYGDHIAPYDIEVRELGTGKSRKEVAQQLGLNFKAARKLPFNDGINAVRMMLPMCWFDEKKTEHLVQALLSYHKVYDRTRREWTGRPDHNWASHGADSVRTGAVGRRNARVPKERDRYRIDKYYARDRRRSWMSA